MHYDKSSTTSPSATLWRRCSANTLLGRSFCHPILPQSGPLPRRRYPEVRNLELRQLTKALLATDPSAVRHALRDKIKAYGCGRLPYARDILPAFYERMESIGSFKERTESIKPLKGKTSVPSAPSSQGAAAGGLKDALTRSLTSGTFLDSQFYALDSKAGSDTPSIRPIHFCSMANSTFMPKLRKCRFPVSGP